MHWIMLKFRYNTWISVHIRKQATFLTFLMSKLKVHLLLTLILIMLFRFGGVIAKPLEESTKGLERSTEQGRQYRLTQIVEHLSPKKKLSPSKIWMSGLTFIWKIWTLTFLNQISKFRNFYTFFFLLTVGFTCTVNVLL